MFAVDDLEQHLIARASQGDDAAFERIVSLHRARVHRLAMLHTQDHAQADEIAQLTFVRLFQSLRGFRQESTLATWLHRVTLNLCRDLARRQHRDRRLVPLTALSNIADTSSSAASPDLGLISEAADREVHDAVRQLPDELRELVALRFGGNQSYPEMAETLGIPLGTVCTRMQRALRTLAVHLTSRKPETPR